MVKVYTVITGAYDKLRPTPWPSTCWVDKPIRPADGWTQRQYKFGRLDLRRASRLPKMMPHRFFPDAEYTLYIDGNIDLLCDPEELVAKYLKRRDLAMFPHPQRDCIYEEAQAVLARKKDRRFAVESQVNFYRKVGFPEHFGLTACFVILRRHTQKINELGELWWQVYLQHSQRDQLSFDFVRWKLGVEYEALQGDLLVKASECFRRRRH